MVAHTELVRAFVQKVQQGKEDRIIEVEAPDASKAVKSVLGDDAPPFIVKFRPRTLEEMVEMGDLPPVLMEELDVFNTSVLAYQLEHMPDDDASETERDQLGRQSIAAALREQGAAAFQRRTRMLRDATICLCAIEPKIVASELEVADPDNEVPLTYFSSKDRDLMHQAIQKEAGDTTTEELKSMVESDSSEAPDADLEEGEGHEPDTSGSGVSA